MTAQVYFQWQNEVLLKTIYPLRALKLQDFLVYFREVELWAEYKDKTRDSLSGEINDYIKTQVQAVIDMKTAFACFRDYFTNPLENNPSIGFLKSQTKPKEWVDLQDVIQRNQIDVKATVATSPAADEYIKISRLHNTCQDYLKIRNIYNGDLHKEKIFMAQRVSEWEEHYKDLYRKWQRNQVQGQTNRYEDAVNMAKAELDYLHQFIAFYNKIDTRRGALVKPRTEKLAEKANLENQINPLKIKVGTLQGQINDLQDIIRRIQARPDINTGKQYFSANNLFTRFVNILTGSDVTWYSKFDGLWKTINMMVTTTRGNSVLLISIKNEIEVLKNLKSDMERRITELQQKTGDATAQASFGKLKDFDLTAITTELDKLSDLRVALEFIYDDKSNIKTEDQINLSLKTKQDALADLQQQLQQPVADLQKKQADLDAVNNYLDQSADKNLLDYLSDNPMEAADVTNKDIVNFKIENYRKELADLELADLLERVVDKFLAAPDEYPLWLQYMVIHFSGMRYASAHGSWADPKDLLINLSSSFDADNFRSEPDDSIQARCEEKVDLYTNWQETLSEQGRVLPKLLQVQNPAAQALEPRDKWKGKIDDHLDALNEANTPDQRRKALLDLLIDEATYQIESMTPNDILDTLRGIRNTLELPDWMWDEIVKLTELRATEVTSDDWEKPIDTKAVQNTPEFKKYSEMMSEWKKNNLTSWREAHRESEGLLVTRAVCNEVAEHIQHLRGHRGGAGLTSKPDWYKREEKKFGKGPADPHDDQHPYFIKPKILEKYKEDFQVGASILWLHFVNDFPPDWQIAKPLETTQGDELIPAEYKAQKDKTVNWVYTLSSTPKEHIERERQIPGKGNPHQYLRWLHEATVVKVVDTAEGETVLTFETSQPNEDRRLSTIGVFKRYARHLVGNPLGEEAYNAAFVGFVPEGGVSTEDWDEYSADPILFMENQKKFVENLEEMMDWNKILRRQRLTPEQLLEYQETYIRNKLPTAPPKEPPKEGARPTAKTKTAEELKIKNVAGRPEPLRAWRVKWDWEGVSSFKGVRTAAPDPCVFRCGELEDNQNFDFTTLTEEWQVFWFELCCKNYWGCYSNNLTRQQKKWTAKRWEGIGGNRTAFNNGHGLDVFKNYILREPERMNMPEPKIAPLVCGGATLTGEIVTNSKGIQMLKVDHFDGTKSPPSYTQIDPDNDPRVFYATTITDSVVNYENREGYGVIPFAQLAPANVPIPLIAKTDIYYPLSDLEEIFTGIKPSPYFPPRN